MRQGNSKKKEYLALFDLDGTLYDTGEVNYYAYKDALKSFGIALDKRFFVEECNGKHYTEFLPLVISDLTLMGEIHERKKNADAENLGKARKNKHLFEIIDTLKEKYHIALVTTASRKNTMDILSFFGHENLFEYIVTQEDIVKTKPDPEGFILAMEYFDTIPENTIIFEDSDVGIQAAKSAGATVMAVTSF